MCIGQELRFCSWPVETFTYIQTSEWDLAFFTVPTTHAWTKSPASRATRTCVVQLSVKDGGRRARSALQESETALEEDCLQIVEVRWTKHIIWVKQVCLQCTTSDCNMGWTLLCFYVSAAMALGRISARRCQEPAVGCLFQWKGRHIRRPYRNHIILGIDTKNQNVLSAFVQISMNARKFPDYARTVNV